MDFEIDRDRLRYIATMMAELGEVVISPSRKELLAYDGASTRRFTYAIPASKGDDIGIDPVTISKVARRVRGTASMVLDAKQVAIKTGNTTYKLRLMVPPTYMAKPKSTSMGEVVLSAADLGVALKDVAATGIDTVVITIDKDAVVFRGDGPTDCRITVPGAKVSGRGYSRLDLTLLTPCVPALKDCTATITLAPKGPTVIRYGDDMVYHQAQRR